MKKHKTACARKKKRICLVIYRKAKAKEVTQVRLYSQSKIGYCVCPGCKCTFEREYQSYCDRCGQKLAWNLFNQRKILLIKRIPCKLQQKKASVSLPLL